MAHERILIVEDDKNISRLVKYNLDRAGYDCVTVDDGEEALDSLKQRAADLVILDIMLPKMDGLEVCRAMKREERLKHIPVIMLTAKGEEVDRVVGFELGADDYMVKPFSPRELVLRVKAVLRRKAPSQVSEKIYRAGSLSVDVSAHRVLVGSKEVVLTAMEFKLLATLLDRRGRVQSRDRLLSDVWGIDADVFTRTVDTHVKRLREKLGKAGLAIETVVGVGYRFRKDEDEE